MSSAKWRQFRLGLNVSILMYFTPGRYEGRDMDGCVPISRHLGRIDCCGGHGECENKLNVLSCLFIYKVLIV